MSSGDGISWIRVTDCEGKAKKMNYTYGITLLSSGKFYEFFYDFESNKRMPVFYQCFDCGYPETIGEAFEKWKIDGDTVKLSKWQTIVIRKITEDSLFVSYIQAERNLECKTILVKLKNSILDTIASDNILSPRG